MSKTELIAEAIYQLAEAQKTKFKTEYIDNSVYTFYNNGLVTISDGVDLDVQFEMNSKIYSVNIK